MPNRDPGTLQTPVCAGIAAGLPFPVLLYSAACGKLVGIKGCVKSLPINKFFDYSSR